MVHNADAACHSSGNVDHRVDGTEFVCPVCSAQQPVADECRRCRADLSLVVSVRSEWLRLRRQCLVLMRQRRWTKATRVAQACLELSNDPATKKLLACCYLMQGDFAKAILAK